MMMEFAYKRLNADNVKEVKRLRQVFARAFAEDETWNASQPSDTYLVKVLADTNYIAVAATEGSGEVVGGLTAYVLPKIDQEHSEIYLYDLAVTLEHHRQGIATRLITELKRIAKTYGAYTIFVQADNEDFEAVALYKKLSSSIATEITHFDIAVR